MRPIDQWNNYKLPTTQRAEDYILSYLDDYYSHLSTQAFLQILNPTDNKIIYLHESKTPSIADQFRRFANMNSNLMKEAIFALPDTTGFEVKILADYAKKIWAQIICFQEFQHSFLVDELFEKLYANEISPRDFLFSFIHTEESE